MLKRLALLLVLLGLCGAGATVAWRVTRHEPTPFEKAMDRFAAKDIVGAQRIARLVVRTEPRNADAHLLLARTAVILADWLSVEKESRTLRLLGYDRMVVDPMLTRALMAQGRSADVLNEIPAVAVRPEAQAVDQALRSWAYLSLDDRLLARSSLEAAQQTSRTHPIVLLQSARMAAAQSDDAAALRHVEAVLDRYPFSTEALLMASEILARQGDRQGALKRLDAAIAVTPQSPPLRLARAWLLIDLGSDAAAKQDVDAVLALAGRDPQASYLHAWLTFRDGRHADALSEFDRLAPVLDQFPMGYLYRAQAAVALGSLQSAGESLDRLLKLRPGEAEGVHLAAQLDLQTQQPLRAVAVLEPFVAASPRDGAAQDLLGRAYFMQGRTQDAITSFEQASTLVPDNKDYAAHLEAAKTRFGQAPLPDNAAAAKP